MIAIKRAARDDFQYPCIRELSVMAKRLIEYYPMLQDKSPAGGAEWVCQYSVNSDQCLYGLISTSIFINVCCVFVRNL